MNAIVGDWGKVIDTSIIGIHQVLLGDGRVLYWGGDGNGNAFSNTVKYGVFDPATGQHEILSASHAVRMFCGAGVIVPGTDQVLISGGNGSGDRGGQIFDLSEESLSRDPANDMNDGRFYPTTVSLSTGQVVVIGGKDAGTPEIFTLGEGWRDLSGATDPDVKANWWYPRAWVNKEGEILYVAVKNGNQNASVTQPGTLEIMALDPSGEGSIRQVGEIPFQMDVTSPAAMYDVGKVVMMDHKGDLWIMDINGDTPTFNFVADLNVDRNNSDMTVLPDGRVIINGGTTVGNSQNEANAVYQSVIFDPYSGEVSYVDSESVMRLYHSSTVLLADGTILSMGGGGLGGTKDFMDAQVYSPDYLFSDDGTLADRPEITDAPDSLKPGQTFTITVDDASAIARISFVKTGAVTHSINMESGRMDLALNVLSDTQIEVTLPDNPNIVGAGNWMLFAINDAGVPSVAPIVAVQPTLTPHDGIGDVTVEYFAIDPSVTSLDQIDFNADSIHTEKVAEIRDSGSGAFFAGGPADDFAIRYTGEFEVSQGGTHTFYLTSDDGSRLFIDGQEVIDNDGMQAPTLKTVSVNLDTGKHVIEVRYFEGGGPGTIDLDWAGPGFARKQMTFDGGLGPDSPGPSNTAPIAGDDTATTKTGEAVAINVLANDSDADGDTLSIVSVSTPANGTAVIDDRGTANTADDRIVYTPKAGFTGTETLTYTISDGTDAATASITIKVEDDTDPGVNVIVADPAGGHLFGTEQDDEFRGGVGDDTFYGLEGDDIFDGGGGDYNQVDYDGAAADYVFARNDDGAVTISHPEFGNDTLKDIDALWFSGEDKWYPLEELLGGTNPPPPPPGGTNVIETGDDGGYFFGTNGKDEFRGGAGVDVFYGGRGDDIYDGAGGYNQVDYDGSAADYTFVRNADGTVTATHPDYGTDTLKDIGGIWFYGEGAWYALDQLAAAAPGEANIITADDTGGYLAGSVGDDEFRGGAGNDTFYGDKGDDIYKGGAGGYDQVDFSGTASDYTFTRNADGTITASHAEYGEDILQDIDGVFFYGDATWMSTDDLGT